MNFGRWMKSYLLVGRVWVLWSMIKLWVCDIMWCQWRIQIIWRLVRVMPHIMLYIWICLICWKQLSWKLLLINEVWVQLCEGWSILIVRFASVSTVWTKLYRWRTRVANWAYRLVQIILPRVPILCLIQLNWSWLHLILVLILHDMWSLVLLLKVDPLTQRKFISLAGYSTCL